MFCGNRTRGEFYASIYDESSFGKVMEPIALEADQVPFALDDFESDRERALICDPWQVTDDMGQVLRQWLGAQQVFRSRGKVRVSLETIADSPA